MVRGADHVRYWTSQCVRGREQQSTILRKGEYLLRRSHNLDSYRKPDVGELCDLVEAGFTVFDPSCTCNGKLSVAL